MTSYYGVLEIKRNVSAEEIDAAYRRLALKYHPQRNKGELAANTAKFAQISKAYEVLSDLTKKAVYDQFGETVLKEGFLDAGGQKVSYKFGGNATAIFDRFYERFNPFSSLVDIAGGELKGSMFGSAYGGANQRPLPAPKELVIDCKCTLEELYMGCTKNLPYERDVLGLDQRSTHKKSDSLDIVIKPGFAQGTILRFPRKGNEAACYPASDLVVKILELAHPRYKRKGNDLIYVHGMLLVDSLCAAPFEVETLDHRRIMLPLDEIATPNTRKVVQKEGMPICKEDPETMLREQKGQEKEKGDLWVEFDIEFPEFVEEANKKVLKEILGK